MLALTLVPSAMMLACPRRTPCGGDKYVPEVCVGVVPLPGQNARCGNSSNPLVDNVPRWVGMIRPVPGCDAAGS